MKNEGLKYILCGVVGIFFLVAGYIAAEYVVSLIHGDTPVVVREAIVSGDEFGKRIEVHRETIYVRDGDIREQKEIEVRALPPDQLAGRHLAALERFGGVSADRESSSWVGSD